MKLLLSGDIVGSPGRTAFACAVTELKSRRGIDFVVANGENAAAGRGITRKLADELFAAGADVITMGDHVWDQKELAAQLSQEPRILRPANYAPACPGAGWVTRETAAGRVTVINLVGRVFLGPSDCPFRTVDAILTRERNLGRIIVVDLHAEATSEKIAMGRFLDGRVSAVVGTHTHVQTADETVLPKGTAYITDLGMTGPTDSVIGRETATILQVFTTGMPAKFEVASEGVMFQGALVDIDEKTGRARSITRIRQPMLKPAAPAGGGR